MHNGHFLLMVVFYSHMEARSFLFTRNIKIRNYTYKKHFASFDFSQLCMCVQVNSITSELVVFCSCRQINFIGNQLEVEV